MLLTCMILLSPLASDDGYINFRQVQFLVCLYFHHLKVFSIANSSFYYQVNSKEYQSFDCVDSAYSSKNIGRRIDAK